jgi:hypothetical protein
MKHKRKVANQIAPINPNLATTKPKTILSTIVTLNLISSCLLGNISFVMFNKMTPEELNSGFTANLLMYYIHFLGPIWTYWTTIAMVYSRTPKLRECE